MNHAQAQAIVSLQERAGRLLERDPSVLHLGHGIPRVTVIVTTDPWRDGREILIALCEGDREHPLAIAADGSLLAVDELCDGREVEVRLTLCGGVFAISPAQPRAVIRPATR